MSKRIHCLHCQRPEKTCICTFVSPVQNKIHVVILQHPSEISQTKGTVSLLAKSLHYCQVIIGEDFSDNEQLNQVLAQYNCLLLYPSEKSKVLSSDLHCCLVNSKLQNDQELAKEFKKYCLIVIDGTWKKAYKMFKLSQTLQQIPQVCLPESLASTGQYHIRKVAKNNALSSLEACCFALSLLEGSDKYQTLLAKFNDFNQFQLSFRPKEHLSAQQTSFLGKN